MSRILNLITNIWKKNYYIFIFQHSWLTYYVHHHKTANDFTEIFLKGSDILRKRMIFLCYMPQWLSHCIYLGWVRNLHKSMKTTPRAHNSKTTSQMRDSFAKFYNLVKKLVKDLTHGKFHGNEGWLSLSSGAWNLPLSELILSRLNTVEIPLRRALINTHNLVKHSQLSCWWSSWRCYFYPKPDLGA